MQGENIFGAQADERFFLCLHARLQNPAERCRWVRFEGYKRSNLESSVTKGHQSNEPSNRQTTEYRAGQRNNSNEIGHGVPLRIRNNV